LEIYLHHTTTTLLAALSAGTKTKDFV